MKCLHIIQRMAYRRFNFYNEVLDFELTDFEVVVKSYVHTNIPFSIYIRLNKNFYYLHDENLNRLFVFQEEFGGVVQDGSEMGDIILDYFLAYPGNQVVD